MISPHNAKTENAVVFLNFRLDGGVEYVTTTRRLSNMGDSPPI